MQDKRELAPMTSAGVELEVLTTEQQELPQDSATELPSRLSTRPSHWPAQPPTCVALPSQAS